MDLEFDEAKLLYGLGALFGVGALLYFARDLVFELSVAVKSLLLLLGFVGFFAAANAIERPTLDTVLYVLSGGAYVVFLGYTLARYDVGDTGTFLALGASSALFVGLGYLLRERSASLSWGQARYVLVGVAAAATLLVVVDLLGGGIVYTAALDEQVAAGGDDHRVVVGTVVARNEFVAARSVSPPTVEACVYDPERRDASGRLESPDPHTHGAPDVLGGGDEAEMEIEVWYDRPEHNETERTFAVERAGECPDAASVEEPTIVVVLDGAVGER